MAPHIFLIAGEQSGDQLGARLMQALNDRLDSQVRYSGVGGSGMERQGLASLFPLSDVAVMGIVDILRQYPRLRRRALQTVEHAIIENPDLVVIIDSPEFTHPIARRIRAQSPDVPIINYVSPQVWAWRPGRARKMTAYINHIMALLPFEPEAMRRLGGPPCTYVGHPLIEKRSAMRQADHRGLAAQLGIEPGRKVLAVLPGSRRSEVRRLMPPFGAAIRLVQQTHDDLEVVVPALPALRELIEELAQDWPLAPHLVEGETAKFQAFRLADAALVASGTATLELALAGVPMVVGYVVDPISPIVRFLIKTPSIVLANLVLGENVIPEFIQRDCTPAALAQAVTPLLSDTPQRRTQTARLDKIAHRMHLATGTPSEAAAKIVLDHLPEHSHRGERL